MALADYAHWNEEAEQVWWQEEGRFAGDNEGETSDYEEWEEERQYLHDEDEEDEEEDEVERIYLEAE